MDKVKQLFPMFFFIVLGILYYYVKSLDKSLVDRLMDLLYGPLLICFGAFIMRNSKRFTEERIEQFSKSSSRRLLGLQYREGPLRLTINLVGVVFIAIGVLGSVLELSRSPNDAFEGFRGIVLIAAILTAAGSGIIAIIAALLMFRRE